jgi:hypothetical protein
MTVSALGAIAITGGIGLVFGFDQLLRKRHFNLTIQLIV